jgi:ABC-type polysaccharide/polyol phosphate export permease
MLRPPVRGTTGTDPTAMLPGRSHLFLLRELVKRDFQGRYAGSLLSFLWSFVQPLWLLVLFTVVFGYILAIKVDRMGAGTDNFGVFIFSGLLPRTAIQEGLMRSTTAITDNAELVKKLRFPAWVLVLSVVLSALLHQAIAAGIFMVVLGVLGELSWTTLPWLLVAVPLQVALTLGLALLLAPCHVFFRDTGQVLGMVTTAWFYFTPIVYPLSWVPEKLAPWIEANPLTPLVGLYRTALLGREWTFGPSFVGLVLAALLALALGVTLFRRVESSLVDEI